MKAARKELHPSPSKRVAKPARSASKKARKTRSNAGKPRGPRKAASKKARKKAPQDRGSQEASVAHVGKEVGARTLASPARKSASKSAAKIRFGSSARKSSLEEGSQDPLERRQAPWLAQGQGLGHRC
jgi:hypothetical protein